MNFFKIILLGLIPLMLNGCENPDNKTIEIYFITHTKNDINNLRLTDNAGYEVKVGSMSAPENLAGMSFMPPPSGNKGKLHWTDGNNAEQSRDIDLGKLKINPPGILFLALNNNDLETTYIKTIKSSYTPEEKAQKNALLDRYFYDNYHPTAH